MKWTKHQQDAIDFKDGSLLISAGAGSGKTAVLTERFVSLITGAQSVDADRILVLTFSNAAAGELKTRIFNKLYEKNSANKKDKNIARQIMLLKRAQISTVHSFCLNLLKEYSANTDLPFNFSVADGFQAERIKDQAADNALALLYQDEKSGFKELSSLFSSARSDNKVKDILISFDDFLSMFPNKQQFEKDFFDIKNDISKFEQNPVIKTMFSFSEKAANAAFFYASKAAELCAFSDGFSDLSTMLGDEADGISRILSLIKNNDWDGCRNVILTMAFARFKTDKGCDKEIKEQVKTLRDNYKKIINDVLKDKIFLEDKATILKEFGELSSFYKQLFYAANVFSNEFTRLKRQKNLVDFCDLEQKAIELLTNPDGTRSAAALDVAQNFDYIMVDEFQDTNEVQSHIFTLVSSDKQNLFAVGDVKQSIYSFRRADPKIFLDMKSKSQPLGQNTQNSYLSLNENFRSSHSVIDAVNRLFNPIFTTNNGDIDYEATEQLVAKKQTLTTNDAPPLSMYLVTSNEDLEAEEVEADFIAQTIKDMLDGGYQVDDGKTLRPAVASDFAILLRSVKGKAQHYKQALVNKSIPTSASASEDFFENYEIELLLSFLKVLDNPSDDVAVSAILMSPIFGFSADELANVTVCEEKHLPLFMRALKSDDQKAKEFSEIIKHLIAKKTNLSVISLIEHVLDTNNAELVLCAGESFDEKTDNIACFLSYAANYSERDDATLKGFIETLEFAKKTGKELFSSSQEGAKGVSIMSIHKSKGLEWPVVFIANSKNQFNKTDTIKPVMFDNDVGIGAKLRYIDGEGELFPKIKKTAAFRAIELSTTAKMQSEQMRVLYVAATRAKQKLFITSGFNDYKDISSAVYSSYMTSKLLCDYAVGKQNSFLQWCLSSLLQNLGPLNITKEQFPNVITSELFCIQHIQHDVKQQTEQPVEVSKIEQDFDVESIRQKINFIPKTKELFDVPGKLSVSMLSKQGKKKLQMPYFAFSNQGIAAKKGTALHLFMQYANYQNAKDNLSLEISRLVDNRFISSEDGELLDHQKLEAFFNGELAKRILNGEVLREYAFFDFIKANSVVPLSPQFEQNEIVVQGIADCIILEKGGAVVVDYKSDKVDSVLVLKERYETQLELYSRAIEKRLSRKVTERIIYSFYLNDYITF